MPAHESPFGPARGGRSLRVHKPLRPKFPECSSRLPSQLPPIDFASKIDSTNGFSTAKELLARLASVLSQLEAENDRLWLLPREGTVSEGFAARGDMPSVPRAISGSAQGESEKPKTVDEEHKLRVAHVPDATEAPRHCVPRLHSRGLTAASTMTCMTLPDLPRTAKEKPRLIQEIDTCIIGIILLNAIVLALSLDIDPFWVGWGVFEYLFFFVYFSEVAIKLLIVGFYEYFQGEDCYWNIFDTCIVSFGVFELVLTIVMEMLQRDVASDMNGIVRLIKVARLTRLTRVVRLLRYQIFAELKGMMLGVLSGLRVLFWAIVLFFVFVFLIAIILRSSVGESKQFKDTFSRVPWAMFTLFRCFTDGCTTHDGTPLQAHLYARYGAVFSLSYVACFLFVTIGLFNLIMATFVDNVMESAKHRRQKERAGDKIETERALRTLMGKLMKMDEISLSQTIKRNQSSTSMYSMITLNHPTKSLFSRVSRLFPSSRSGVADAVARASEAIGDVDETPGGQPHGLVTPEIFIEWLAIPEFRSMLEALEISTSNPRELFDVLDADMSSELTEEELVVGLMSLRGPAEKSFTVASLLCIRVVQDLLRNFISDSEDRHSSLLQALQQSSRNARQLSG